jgi:hypothetical protein
MPLLSNKMEIGNRKAILKAGREINWERKERLRRGGTESHCINQFAAPYSTSLAEMNMSTRAEVLSSWRKREQECAEAWGKVVIALYSGHYTDHIYPCKWG